MSDTMVPGIQKLASIDGHGLNESYKMPAAHPSGRANTSYMHPQVKPLNLEAPRQSVDKTLAEASRPEGQLSRSKTIAPVSSNKTRGVPSPPAFAKASRSSSHAPAMPGALAGPPKPTVF